MTSNDKNYEGGRAKSGFAGLTSLVSDVSTIIESQESGTPPNAGSATANRVTEEIPENHEDHRVSSQNENNPIVTKNTEAGVLTSAAQGESKGIMLTLVIIGLFILFVFVTKFIGESQESDDRAEYPLVSVVPSENNPPMPKEASLEYAVAALKANVRAQPSIRSKVVGTLNRGSPVVPIEKREDFIRLRTESGLEGWISSELLIHIADLNRLRSLAPAEYIAGRERFQPIDRLREHVGRQLPLAHLLLEQVAAQKGDTETTVRKLQAQELPFVEVDDAAQLWFSMSARAAANAGKHTDAVENAFAAIYADPFRVDHHTALGFSAISLEHHEILSFATTTLAVLAPDTTNTWVVVGVNAAIAGEKELAYGAILTALQRSRSRRTTVRVLEGIAERSTDPGVKATINGVLLSSDGSSELSEAGTGQ